MKSIEKKYYKIGEVARLTDLPLSTLRFWEQQFTVIKPHRNDKGTRFYTPRDIEKIRMVAYMVKEKGLKLAAAEAALKANSSGTDRRYEAIKRLKEIRQTLQTIYDSLDNRLSHS